VSFNRLFRCALIFFSALTTVVGAAPLPTNMDLITATVERAVERALAEMNVPEPLSAGTLLVHSQTKDPANWLLDHVLVERLLNRGFAVTLDSTTVQPGAMRLAFRILDLGVHGHAGLLGGSIKRQSRVSLAFSLSQGDTLRWQEEFSEQQTDHVPKSRLDLLENASYSFAKTDIESKSWGKFVEPAIVSTVLGGLIYLFFSNR